jgi:hypothetical protein
VLGANGSWRHSACACGGCRRPSRLAVKDGNGRGSSQFHGHMSGLKGVVFVTVLQKCR